MLYRAKCYECPWREELEMGALFLAARNHRQETGHRVKTYKARRVGYAKPWR